MRSRISTTSHFQLLDRGLLEGLRRGGRVVLLLGLLWIFHAGPLPAPIPGAVPAWAASTAPTIEERPDLYQQDPDLRQVRQLLIAGNFAAAESLSRAHLQQVDKTTPKDSLAVALSLDSLVQALVHSGQLTHPELDEMAARALELRRSGSLPAWSSFVPLHNFALLYHRRGDYPKALEFAQRAADVAREFYPPTARERVLSLNLLSVVYYAQGDAEHARPPMEECIALLESDPEANPIEIASLTQNLGALLTGLGEYEAAQERFARSLELWESANMTHHPEYARNLDYLADLGYQRGDYVGARDLFERALSIKEEVLGAESPEICWDLVGLGGVLTALGDYEEAESYYRRSIELREKSTGAQTSNLAFDLEGLAWLEFLRRDFAQSVELLERALRMQRASGSTGFRLGRVLQDLASAETRLGRFAAAQDHLAHAQNEWRAIGSPLLANTLESQGYLALFQGRLDEARRSFTEALELVKTHFGPQQPMQVSILNGLGQTALAQHDAAGALRLALEAEDLSRENARASVRYLEERTAVALVTQRARPLDLAISARASQPEDDASPVLDRVVRGRGLVFDDLAERRMALQGGQDQELLELQSRLREARSRLANLLVSRPTEDPARDMEQLRIAQREKTDLERELAARSQPFRRRLERRELGLADIRARLADDEALVSYVQYDPLDREGRLGRRIEQPAYAAFVVRGSSGPLRIQPLGDKDEIDALVQTWRHELAEGERDATRSPRAAERDCRVAGAALRMRIWDPLVEQLEGVETIFLVPDGSLQLINFAALPSGRLRYLIEDGPLLHLLSTERDLVPQWNGPGRRDLLAVSDVDYGERATVHGMPAAQSTRETAPVDCAEIQDLVFEPLTATSTEVKAISRLWRSSSEDGSSVTILRGQNADESHLFDGLGSHRIGILHLATHGFFLEEECSPDPGGLRGRAIDRNPLLLSGLALAGANDHSRLTGSEEDGILTAEEIASLDLQGLRWAVLSACDTGLGSVTATEGVFGLRRAFLLAGARSVIMSLWSVDDRDSALWMRSFYESHLVGDMGTAQAVRAASLALLQRRRAEGETTHPFHWAAFVAVGDWR